MAGLIRREAARVGHLPDPTLRAPAEARRIAEQLNAHWNDGTPAVASVERLLVPADTGLETLEVEAVIYRVSGAPGTILYLHGGGWALCSLSTHDRAMRLLANETGMNVVGIEYRLAPEAPFPAALHDAVAAWRGLGTAAGLSAEEIAVLGIAGDSAGANIAAALMLFLQGQAERQPDFGLLFYGVYADDSSTPSHRENGDGRFGLSSAKMERYWNWYQPQAERRRDPLASPLLMADAELEKLPPLFMNAAGLDPLRDDSLLLAARLAALRDRDSLVVHEGVVHGFMQMTLELEEARRAFRIAGEWARGRVKHSRQDNA